MHAIHRTIVLAACLTAACGGESTAPPTTPSTPNQRPVPTGLIPAQELEVGETFTVDAASYFSDPDGDALVYEAESSDRNIVSVTLGGSSVTATGESPGEAQVTIRARDPSGRQARQTFDVLVPAPRTVDHAALEALYHALDGPNWISNRNWLSGRPLETWHGIEVDGEGRVLGLNLDFNGLRGELPPELGDLDRLGWLQLGRNEISGSIPDDLSRLYASLVDLRENRLSGAIPPSIGSSLYVVELNLSGNELTGPIPPEMGNLVSLWDLNLSDNQLTGPIPPELGSLEQLRHLLILNNGLTGPLPPELGNLRRLWTLNLSGNPDLSGPLPIEMTSLGGLLDLHLGRSGLCMPAEPAFTTWLGRISRHRIATCGGNQQVLLGQAVQSARFPVPLVAGDSAFLRVFLTAAEGTSVDYPPVRARFYVDGVEAYVAEIPGQSNPVPTEIDESSLLASANAVIPGRVVQPGMEVVVETDPDATLDPALGLTRRIPETGRLAMDVRAMPIFELTMIPYLLEGNQDRSIVDLVSELDPEDELLWDTRTLLPIGEFTIIAHEPVSTTTNSQGALLAQTHMIRVAEGGTGYYMGTMNDSDGGGLAQVGGFASFSDPRADIIAHELGHNMSLSHAPCSATGVDPWYPEPEGRIAAWGYDFRDGGTLVPPDTPDLMGYCDPNWVGDYHFNNAVRHRLAVESQADGSGAHGRSLLLWGGVDEAGTPYLEPAFVLDTRPALPSAAGAYRLRGTTAGGEELFELRFDMPRIADAVDGGAASSFAFALPAREAWAGTLARITLSGPGGSTTMDAEREGAAAIVRDPATGRVRGIFRDLPPAAQAIAAAAAGPSSIASAAGAASSAAARVPAAALAEAVAEALALDPGLEVLVSRGLPEPPDWNR